jgi:nitrogen fixation/metabolism regulation signal transduction histidine kinase
VNQRSTAGAPGGPGFETQLWWRALAIASPALLALAALLYALPEREIWHYGLLAAAFALSLLLAWRLRSWVVFPLYTLGNLLEALREGDFSLRGARAQRNDAIGALVREVNQLAETLRAQRLKVEETVTLLSKVLAAIDLAILSFDGDGRLRLANAAGERLLALRHGEGLGKQAAELGIEDLMGEEGASTLRRSFPGGSGRYEVRRASFREAGRPQLLLVINDLSRALREEERLAWQRLLRVLGHELNNSLAPIRSMADTLTRVLQREPPPEDWRDDTLGGLRVISERADALTRFMLGYTTLARLPPPQRQPVDLAELVQRVGRLQREGGVLVQTEPGVMVSADPDQLEQVLINLVKNAIEASPAGAAPVRLSARSEAREAVVEVEDDGPGIASTDNLFVPFFTTKPGGSGIGLALSRQIVEAHEGELMLHNRNAQGGCVARVRLPLAAG